MQQAFRSIFGAREVDADLPRMADGLVPAAPAASKSDQRRVRDGLTLLHHRRSLRCFCIRSRRGLQVRAVTVRTAP